MDLDGAVMLQPSSKMDVIESDVDSDDAEETEYMFLIETLGWNKGLEAEHSIGDTYKPS